MRKTIILMGLVLLLSLSIYCTPTNNDSGDSGDSGDGGDGGSDMVNLTINIIGNGTVEMNPPGGIYEPGTEITITANPDNNNVFIGWHSPFLIDTEPEQTFVLNTSRTIKAVFYDENVTLYELTIDTPAGVYVQITPDSIYYDGQSHLYEENTILSLLATDTSCGTTFDQWGGDLSGSDNPTTLTMDSDKYVSATVVPAFRLTLNYDDKKGSVTVDPSGIDVGTCQYKYAQGTTVTLTAVPNTGFSFVEWSGDLNSTDNPESVIMNDNFVIDVLFN